MQLISDGVVEREGVAALAARLGYSPRHLGRMLTAELGAGPLALARSNRAQTARLLLVNTNMPVSNIAFAAGFGSIRQCNDTIHEVFGLTAVQSEPQHLSTLGIPWRCSSRATVFCERTALWAGSHGA